MKKKILLGVLLLVCVILLVAAKPTFYMTSSGQARCLECDGICKIQVTSWRADGEPEAWHLRCEDCGRTSPITEDEAKFIIEHLSGYHGESYRDDATGPKSSHIEEIPLTKRVYCSYSKELIPEGDTFWFDPRTKKVSKNPAEIEDGFRFPISREALVKYEFNIPVE